MTPQQANELLPCAHCAGEATLMNMNASTSWQYWMAACECGIQYEGPTAEDCTEMWNRRAPAPTSEPGARFKDHNIRQLVNDLRDIAIQFHAAGQLRERISGAVQQFLATPASPAVPAAPLAPMQKLDYTNYSAPVTMSNSADPAPLVAQASPWISVDEHLPPRYEDVIVWPSPTEYVMTASYGLDRTGNLGWTYSEYVTAFGVEHHIMSKPPTHWMPFTAPEASPLVEDAQRIVAGKVAAMSPIPINDAEMAALQRFHECVTDGEGWDVEKAMMQRLAQIGLVRRVTANFYEHTEFGLAMLYEWVPERATTGNATADDGKDM